MDLNFTRGNEISREERSIPADLYNMLHLLYARRGDRHLFVPIRSMQYLAAIDREEIVFVDGQGPRTIEISWRDFRAGERQDLRAPVSYTCIYYDRNAPGIMNRLQSEFLKAVALLQDRQPRSDGGSVTPLDRH
ncbi:MAG: hypothetical protein J5I92_04175 [Thiogranum sp.]|nr:hypothetical protein [Thiogranum sp.]